MIYQVASNYLDVLFLDILIKLYRLWFITMNKYWQINSTILYDMFLLVNTLLSKKKKKNQLRAILCKEFKSGC